MCRQRCLYAYVFIGSMLAVLMVGSADLQAQGLQLAVQFPAGRVEQVPSAVEATLAVENLGSTVERIVAWQGDLYVVPLEGAAGQITVSQVAIPSSYLFAGASPGPFWRVLENGNTWISDGDFAQLMGAELVPGAAGEVADLLLEIAPRSRGTFQLWMAPADPSMPNTGSYWLSNRGPLPLPFANPPTDPTSGAVLLGVLDVVPEPWGGGMCCLALGICLGWRGRRNFS